MTENKKKFIEILKDDSYGIFLAPTNAQLAVNILCEYLLGEGWYSGDPVSNEQVNTEIVDCILDKYSREYRKDIRKERRRLYGDKKKNS